MRVCLNIAVANQQKTRSGAACAENIKAMFYRWPLLIANDEAERCSPTNAECKSCPSKKGVKSNSSHNSLHTHLLLHIYAAHVVKWRTKCANLEIYKNRHTGQVIRSFYLCYRGSASFSEMKWAELSHSTSRQDSTHLQNITHVK